MLAINTVLSEDSGAAETQIFDEIDTGISGEAANKVGIKLRCVSKNAQVICVTHLAQIAAMADHQLLVEKHQEADSTHTTVQTLDHAGRVSELARMIGGAGDNDESARQHAESMLAQAEQYKASKK